MSLEPWDFSGTEASQIPGHFGSKSQCWLHSHSWLTHSFLDHFPFWRTHEGRGAPEADWSGSPGEPELPRMRQCQENIGSGEIWRNGDGCGGWHRAKGRHAPRFLGRETLDWGGMLILHDDNVWVSCQFWCLWGRKWCETKRQNCSCPSGVSEGENLSSWSPVNQSEAKSRRAQRLCPTNVVYSYPNEVIPVGSSQAELSLQLPQVQVRQVIAQAVLLNLVASLLLLPADGDLWGQEEGVRMAWDLRDEGGQSHRCLVPSVCVSTFFYFIFSQACLVLLSLSLLSSLQLCFSTLFSDTPSYPLLPSLHTGTLYLTEV